MAKRSRHYGIWCPDCDTGEHMQLKKGGWLVCDKCDWQLADPLDPSEILEVKRGRYVFKKS